MVDANIPLIRLNEISPTCYISHWYLFFGMRTFCGFVLTVVIAISWRGRLKAIRLLCFENKRYFLAFWAVMDMLWKGYLRLAEQSQQAAALLWLNHVIGVCG